IMFDVMDKDGNPLVYGPSSSPKFDGYTFPIPWDVTTRIKTNRLEYQLYFVSTGGFVYDEELQRYVEKEEGTIYQLSHKDGLAIKSSITPKKPCCPPLMAPTTEPSVVGYINLWKKYGLIAPVKTSLDPETGIYTLTFQTFDGDAYDVEMKVDTDGLNAITEDIVVNNPVGGVPAGTVFEKGTKYETILRQILYTEVPEVDLIARYGASTEIPDTYDNLYIDEDETWQTMKSSDGWDVVIITGIEEGGIQIPQYAVIAVNDVLQPTNWYAKSMPFVDFVQTGHVLKVEKDGYNLWYLDSPTYDSDLGGTEFIIKFKEV
ncbi:MAG: hypothetical protein IJV02_05635, partial [Candidatus Methanomethylophilaceae archaeon]|nr:hypothetical protein [Candidatus Methanomethylophilaceae archaeon]